MAALDRGIGVLAMRVGACTLLRLPLWESVTGAAWVDGQSMHPRVGVGRTATFQRRHSICAPVEDFDVIAERYAWLRVTPGTVPLAAREHAGQSHPLLWACEYRGPRVVTNLRGHDERSYDNLQHRLLVARSALWLGGEV